MTWIGKHPLIAELLTAAAVFAGILVIDRFFFHLSMDESLKNARFVAILIFVAMWVRRKITTRRRRIVR
jgi:hypothetical protein